MKIGLFHGYNLGGSGSNEYTRYLAMALLNTGAEVHLICRETAAESLGFVDTAIRYSSDGESTLLFDYTNAKGDGQQARCYLHEMPLGSVQPVYVTDKQRDGVVKSFSNLSDEELQEYEDVSCAALRKILNDYPLDILHCNHVTYQPQIAEGVCAETDTPYLIYPHGSAIEYTVKTDTRYFDKVRESIKLTDGLVIGNNEVRNRIISLYPDLEDLIMGKSDIVGVGVDTDLFTDCQHDERQASLQAMCELPLSGGKTPELTRELEARLDNGELDAVTDYRNAYVQKLPDDNATTKLAGIDLDKPVLLFVGALTAGKGLQGLLCAMSMALRNNPDIQLAIVGAGAYRESLEAFIHLLSTGDRQLLDAMAAQGFDLDYSDMTGGWEDVQYALANHADEILEASKLLKERVHFIGRLNHDELKYLFPIVDLAVFPSVVPEAYPLVLMESLSNGVLPMVSYFSGFTDGIDELEDVIPDSLLQYMRIPMDPSERIVTMAKNLDSLLASPELATIKPQLRKVACDRYDWTLRAEQMISAYQWVIDKRNNGQRKAA